MAYKIIRFVACIACLIAAAVSREMDFVTWSLLLILSSDLDYLRDRLPRPTTEEEK